MEKANHQKAIDILQLDKALASVCRASATDPQPRIGKVAQGGNFIRARDGLNSGSLQIGSK